MEKFTQPGFIHDEFKYEKIRLPPFLDAHDIRQRSKRDVGTLCGLRSRWLC
ncbi:hypothetical protein LINGRAHAP2_LOCUS2310 [Linum grandiflorum]